MEGNNHSTNHKKQFLNMENAEIVPAAGINPLNGHTPEEDQSAAAAADSPLAIDTDGNCNAPTTPTNVRTPMASMINWSSSSSLEDGSAAAGESSGSGSGGVQVHCENHCILVPNQEGPVSHFALDIGGSLIKMVYFVPNDIYSSHVRQSDGDVIATKGGKILFARFETADIERCFQFMQQLLAQSGDRQRQQQQQIYVTGGGAFKYAAMFQERFGISIDKIDEMDALITGLNFLLKNIRYESFTYNRTKLETTTASAGGVADGVKNFIHLPTEIFPYLMVNIGSGVSIVKVDNDSREGATASYQRVSGSSLGGGTFWGLARLLTHSHNFDEVLALSLRGDNRSVDMLVGDIYGHDYSKIGLSAETIASSFGAIVKKSEEELEAMKPEDTARALLFMICNNIGQIAYLNAMRFNLKRIYFGGYFIRDHPITMSCISYAINFWSRGEIQALFLRHDGYLGALGAFFHP